MLRDTCQAIAHWIYANQAVSYVCEVVTWGGLTPQTTAGKGGFPLLVDPLINFMDFITLIYHYFKLLSEVKHRLVKRNKRRRTTWQKKSLKLYWLTLTQTGEKYQVTEPRNSAHPK